MTPSVPPSLNAFNQLLGNYQTAALTAQAALTPYAQHLLMALFTIELVWTACLWSLSARSGYDILEQLCRRGIAIGLMYWFLTNAMTILLGVFNGFQQLGAKAIGVSNLSPSGVFTLGIQMAGTIMDGYFHWSFWIAMIKGDSGGGVILLPVLAAFVIVLAFTIAAAWYLMTMIEMYILIAGGSIVTALGGSPFTGALWTRLISRVIGLGLRLMFIILTLGVGMQLANNWLTFVQSASNITPTEFFYLIANAIMFLITVLGVPYMVSSLANDSVTFGLAQAFEAAWLAGTIAQGVKSGLKLAKVMGTRNANSGRTAASRNISGPMPGPQPNYPPPPPSSPSPRSGPPAPLTPASGPGNLPGASALGAGGDGSANGANGASANGRHKTHLTLDLDAYRVINPENGNGGKS